MLEQRREGCPSTLRETSSHDGRRIHRQVVEIADEELCCPTRVTVEFEADSIKIWLLRYRGTIRVKFASRGRRIDGPPNPSYSLLLHSTFLCITTVGRVRGKRIGTHTHRLG